VEWRSVRVSCVTCSPVLNVLLTSSAQITLQVFTTGISCNTGVSAVKVCHNTFTHIPRTNTRVHTHTHTHTFNMPQVEYVHFETNYAYIGLFKTIVGVLTTCHTQYTWDSSICVYLFIKTTLQVFVTYLTGALYVHPLWFYKHQHDNRVPSACRLWWFQWRFWIVPSVPAYLREEEEHKPDPWRNPIERNYMGLHLECIVYDPDNHFE